jgi:hypothetical protein
MELDKSGKRLTLSGAERKASLYLIEMQNRQRAPEKGGIITFQKTMPDEPHTLGDAASGALISVLENYRSLVNLTRSGELDIENYRLPPEVKQMAESMVQDAIEMGRISLDEEI